jgi:flagellar biosynthesis component FlhA
MKNAIWRSRAISILGFFILFIVIFPGLPTMGVLFLTAVMGFFVMVLGFIGSRTHAYEEEKLPRPAKEFSEDKE